MENIETVKTVLVINGKYVVSSKKYPVKNLGELRDKIANATYLNNLIKNYLKNNNEEIQNKNLSYICPDCANMLRCPKIMDADKKGLSAYPYITCGAQIIFINKLARENYKLALDEYRERLNCGDESVLKDLGLLDRLSKTGVEVPFLTVYECNNFISDKKKESENRAKDKALMKHYKKFTDVDEIEKVMENAPVLTYRRKNEKKEESALPNFSKFFD